MKTFKPFRSQSKSQPIAGPSFQFAEFVMLEGDRSRVVTLRYPKGRPPTKLRNQQNGRFYYPTGLRDAHGRLVYRMDESDR